MTYPTNQIPSINPQNIVISSPVGLQSAPRDPTAQDNTYVPGTEWQNTVSKIFWKCQSSTIAGAVWIPFAGAGSGTVVSLTANSGAAVGPDGMGNINVVGDGTTINIVGNPGTNTLTASLVGGSVAADTFVTNVSGPVVPTAAGTVNVNASTSTYTDGGTANTLKIELQGTDHAVFIGNGVNTPASTIPVGSNGQVLIGATTADPAFAALTSSGGTITYTTGANSLNLEVTPVPKFLANKSSTTANATGDGTSVDPVIFDVEQFDVGSGYDPATGIYTAPETGIYWIYAQVAISGALVGNTEGQFSLVTSGGGPIIDGDNYNPFPIKSGTTGSSFFRTGTLISLTAGQTIQVSMTVFNGTKVVGIVGASYSGGSGSYFMGFRVV